MKRQFIGKKVLFQITENTGETLGTPINGWPPDSDINEITSLHLEQTTDY